MNKEKFDSLVEDQERGIKETKAALERAKSVYNCMKQLSVAYKHESN